MGSSTVPGLHRGAAWLQASRESGIAADCGHGPQFGHPLPATLDAIAGALPEGWYWGTASFHHTTPQVFFTATKGAEVLVGFADTELLARARAAAKAHAAQKGAKS